MWEPRRLTTLWASTTGYSDSFDFFFILEISILCLTNLQYFQTWQLHVENKRRDGLQGRGLVNVTASRERHFVNTYGICASVACRHFKITLNDNSCAAKVYCTGISTLWLNTRNITLSRCVPWYLSVWSPCHTFCCGIPSSYSGTRVYVIDSILVTSFSNFYTHYFLSKSDWPTHSLFYYQFLT
jgi:hypothetical protein